MKKFRCKSINTDGKIVQNTLLADCETAARTELHKSGYIVFKISEIKNHAAGTRANRLSRQSILRLTSLVTSLLHCGIELPLCLTIAARTANKKDQCAYNKIIHSVQSGTSFSEALTAHTTAIPSFLIQMLHSGEKTNNLLPYMLELEQFLQQQKKRNEAIQSAITYPITVLVLGIIGFGTIIRLLQPQFMQIASLSNATDAQEIIKKQINLYITTGFTIFLVILFLFLVYQSRRWFPHKIRIYIGRMMLRTPYAGPLLLHFELCTWTLIMKIQLLAGLQIETALLSSINGFRLKFLQEELLYIHSLLVKGCLTSSAFSTSQVLPDIIHDLVYISEKTGEPGKAFTQLHVYYSELTKKNRNTLLRLIEPMCIIITGVILIALIYTIIIPTLSIYGDFL